MRRGGCVYMRYQRRGFTLVEMAIVITIIGLVLGGILLGRQLIANSELQEIISNVDRFKKAAKMFHEKYRYLPGDLPTAQTFWGTDSPCPGGAGSYDKLRVETCNGDGNGQIGGVSEGQFPSPTIVGALYYEVLRSWQHLSNAGFIEGSYSGIAYGVGSRYYPGINVPAAKGKPHNGYIMFFASSIDSAFQAPDGTVYDEAFPGVYNHVIEFGKGYSIVYNRGFEEPALTAADAKTIDDKIDDGMPATGNVRSFTRDSTVSGECVTTAAVYNVLDEDQASGEGIACALIFITGF